MRRGLKIVLYTFVFAAITVIVTYAFLKNDHELPYPNNDPVQNDSLDDNIQISGWLTYEDRVYGITLQYPEGWFFETDFDNTLSFEQNQNQSSLTSTITNYVLDSLPQDNNFYVTPDDFFSVSFGVIDRQFATESNGYIDTISQIEFRSATQNNTCTFGLEEKIGNKNVRVIQVKQDLRCQAHKPTNEVIWFDENRIVVFNASTINNTQKREIYHQIISWFENFP